VDDNQPARTGFIYGHQTIRNAREDRRGGRRMKETGMRRDRIQT